MKVGLRLSFLCTLWLSVACQPSPDATQQESAASPASSAAQSPNEPINVRLDPQAFDAKLQQLDNEQLIDVRTPAEYEAGHLTNATMIDFRKEDFREKVAELDKDQPVMVYCAAGGRSTAAAEVLEELGFSQIYELEGGITRWKETGKAVE